MIACSSALLSSIAMSIRQLTPAHLEPFLQQHPEATIVDVREPWEHEIAALKNSRLIPLGLLHIRAEDELEEKEAPVVVYCHHGIRSMQACALLASFGYTDLLNLSGGIDRYSDEIDPSVPKY